MEFTSILKVFVTFFTVIDPIGTIPVFIAVTAKLSAEKKVLAARKAALVAAGILLFFMLVGEYILQAIDVSLANFQIAGGIVLMLFALSMIFGESKPESEIAHANKQDDVAIFPLAIPSLASPGAILAVILLTENHSATLKGDIVAVVLMLLVIGIAWLFMHASQWIFKYMGNSGAAIVSRVMGLILTAVAVTNIVRGIRISFGIDV